MTDGAPTATTYATRRRRNRDVLRSDLIAAARAIFTERGYARATTREIAERARTSEVMLFRCFQSKANLFRSALVEPFGEVLQTFLVQQEGGAERPLVTRSEDFIKGLFDIASGEKDILLALVSTKLYEIETTEKKINDEIFKDYFKTAVAMLQTDVDRLGTVPAVAPEISSRIAFAAVTAAALFRDWLFVDMGLSKDEVIVSLNQFILAATAGVQVRRADQ